MADDGPIGGPPPPPPDSGDVPRNPTSTTGGRPVFVAGQQGADYAAPYFPGMAAADPLPEAAGRRLHPRLIIAISSVAAAILVGVIVAVVGSTGDDGSPVAKAPVSTSTATITADTDTTSEPVTEPVTTTPEAPRPVIAPPPVPGTDTYGEDCTRGFSSAGRSEWGTHAARGSADTSCFFTRSVLDAYGRQNPVPTTDLRSVTARGAVPCSSVGAACRGDDFVMTCRVLGADPWITCQGGKNARVLIY